MSYVIRIQGNIEGLDDLSRQATALLTHGIQSLIQTAAGTWGDSATEAMKEQHGADAQSIHRYVNRTWDLTESIKHDMEPPRGTSPVVHTIRVFAAAPYAFDVEHGVPGRSRAYPFFWKEITNALWRHDLDITLTDGLNDLLASMAEKA